MARCRRKSGLSYWIHPAAQSTLGEQQWDLLVHCAHCGVGFQIKVGRPKFYAGEMITPAQELGKIVIGVATEAKTSPSKDILIKYSSVPNRRAVRNKRAGGKILKILKKH